jgi:hypothetical protein
MDLQMNYFFLIHDVEKETKKLLRKKQILIKKLAEHFFNKKKEGGQHTCPKNKSE